MTRNENLDEFDRKILAIVQRNNLVPHREISDSVGLSGPAVARRLQRLRSTQIITKDISVIDERAVGRPLTICVEVTAESERLDLLDKMKRRFANCPKVQQCYYVTGEADFILVLNVSDMDEYTALTRDLFFQGGNVKSFRTAVAMEKVKTDGPIPL